MGWFGLDGRRKLKLVAILLAGVAAILLVIEQTIGLEQAFYRFTRIVESGLLADVSFGQRIQHTWPAALAVARDYPFGTLISAPRIAALIDSGYLNFYMQGKWVFIASVAVMIGGMLATGLHCLRQAATGRRRADDPVPVHVPRLRDGHLEPDPDADRDRVPGVRVLEAQDRAREPARARRGASARGAMRDDRLRLVYLVSTLRRAGPTSQLLNLLRHLDLARFDPVVVTLSPEPADSMLADFQASRHARPDAVDVAASRAA